MAGFLPISNPISQWVDPRRNALMGFSAGMLSGDPGAAMRYAMQGRGMDQQYASDMQKQAQAEQERNATMEWVKANAPQFATLPPAMAFEAAMKQMAQAQNGASQEQFFAPIRGFDAEGNAVFIQPGNRGGSSVMDLPEGFQPQSRFEKVDLGTEWLVTDTTTGQQQRLPKENYQAAFDTASGGAAGKAVTEQRLAAPSDIAAGNNAVALIDNIRNDPALTSATGLSGVLLNQVPGFDQLGFSRKVEQLKSGAFMTAIENLRGMGALSNAEGQTATAAITRLSTALSAEDFLEALGEYETIVKQGIARAESKLGGGGSTGAPPPADYKTKYGLE